MKGIGKTRRVFKIKLKTDCCRNVGNQVDRIWFSSVVIFASMLFDFQGHAFPPTRWELETAETVGFLITRFRFMLAYFACIPISIVLRFIPSVKARHAYSLLTGILLIYYPFGNGCGHALVTSSLVYLLMKFSPRYCGTMTWLTAFPYLVANHVAQGSGMAWKEGQMDFTGAQMLLTLKLIAIAMCYQDGCEKEVSKLHSYSASKRLLVCPSLFEYYSYLFSFGTLLSGPFFEAKDYLEYIQRTGEWDESRVECRIPNPMIPGTYRFIKGVLCAVLWLYVTNYLGFNEEFLESSKWRETRPWIARCLLLWVTVVSCRFKYYAVWCFSEASLIFAGLGYNMRDKGGKPKWDRYITSHIRDVELNPSLADTPRHWNRCTGLWLRHYVYERLSPPGSRPSFFNMIVTQTVSGVWHGIFPGYWLFFVTSAFMFQASRIIYRYEASLSPSVRTFLPWYVLKVVMSALVLNYAGSAFMVLSYQESIRIWKSVGFFGHIWIAIIFLVSTIFPPRRQRLDKKND